MTHRASLGIAAAALVAGLLTFAGVGLAGREEQQKGGTLRISRGRDIDFIDPALAANIDALMLEFATCANLYNYPDKPAPQGAIAIPEVATGFPKVSAHGKTQTIQLKRTFRFNNGRPVTAANFVAAFNRDAKPILVGGAGPNSHKEFSLARKYLREIVGADAVIAGRAQTISGVRALGRYTLQIRTTRPVLDLVFRLTTPFFCPIAVNTPLAEINDPLGSGPYYVADRVLNRQVVLKRNPFYRGSRPKNVDQIIMTMATGQAACRAAVERNEVDYCAGAGIPQADYQAIVAKYGMNRKGGRFFFNPTAAVIYFAFNHDRRAFKGVGQIPLKQAINLAIDRKALVGEVGKLAGKRTDQFLPPAMTRPVSIYPLGGASERSLAKARALVKKAKFKPKKLVFYADNFGSGPAFAQIFQMNLKRLGIDVEIKYVPHGPTYIDAVGTRGEPFDVAQWGWIPDYADPVALFGPLLDGDLTQTGNTNVAYFNRPKYNREIERIEGLRGVARRNAWANLDVEMMRDDPPIAPVMNPAAQDFVSKSFGCYVFHPVIGRPDLAAACKK